MKVILAILVIATLVGLLVLMMMKFPTKKEKEYWDEDSRH